MRLSKNSLIEKDSDPLRWYIAYLEELIMAKDGGISLEELRNGFCITLTGQEIIKSLSQSQNTESA